MSSYSSDRRRPSGLFTLLLLLAVYVLSFGPVQALYSNERVKGPIPNELVSFYKPVKWLYVQTPIGKPMRTYDAWWNQALKRM